MRVISNEILGGRKGSETRARVRHKWLKGREKWLVVLGLVLHAVYMLSIFDIYFKTPIVHGMEPVIPRFTAPAKRLVLLVGIFCTPLVRSFYQVTQTLYYIASLFNVYSLFVHFVTDRKIVRYCSRWFKSGQVFRT